MIYAIADLHLSFSTDKPMDIFGEKWKNHAEKIEYNWQSLVKPEDTVIIPGDISWAMKLCDTLEDFRFIDRLNGKKVIFKGNHDYFWETNAKLKRFFDDNGITTISMLKNASMHIENINVCGTKGYFYDTALNKEQNAKLLNREAGRLETSLASADNDDEKVVFLHYPPIYKGVVVNELVDTMKRHGVRRCYYGHLHSRAIKDAFEGEYEGIEFKLISCDGIDFCPVKINY